MIWIRSSAGVEREMGLTGRGFDSADIPQPHVNLTRKRRNVRLSSPYARLPPQPPPFHIVTASRELFRSNHFSYTNTSDVDTIGIF